MALNITLSPYTLESVTANDNYFTHYNALDESGGRFIVTEFFPQYMVTRTDGGELVITERFAKEYMAALTKFINLANAMKRINDVTIPKVESVIEMNGTAYLVRPVNELPTLERYMDNKNMPYEEAYLFIRPLLLGLVEAEKSGLMFNFTNNDLHVNRYGQLNIDCVFSWEINLNMCITVIISLFYRLITGRAAVPAKELLAADSGIPPDVPDRVKNMILEILDGDVLYGSLDDFYKKLRSLLESKLALITGDEEKRPDPVIRMRWAIAWLSLLVLLSVGFLFIWQTMIPAFRAVNPNYADPALLDEPPPPALIGVIYRDFSAIAAAASGDSNDILNGAFCFSGGSLYSRAWKNGYCLVKSGSDGAETVLAENVRPSFITALGDYIYFCDGLSDYAIVGVKTDGTDRRVVSENAAAYLYSDGAALYYTNLDDRDRLYKLDLDTMSDEPYIKTAVYGVQSDGGRLFYINGAADFKLYAAVIANPKQQACIADVNGDNLIYQNGMLYYLDVDAGEIRRAAPDGRHVELNCPVKARSFDVSGSKLVIVEEGTFQLFVYDLESGILNQLSNRRTGYVRAQNGTAYIIDYDDSRQTRSYPLS